MAIHKITADTKIEQGMVICATKQAGGISGPVIITKVTASQLHFTQDGKPRLMARSRAAYLCDSEEEGQQLFALFYERMMAVNKAEQEAAAAARKVVIEQYAPKLAALISEAA